MKVTITVKDRQEAQALRIALADPETRALVLMIGTLLQLPTDRARARVLTWLIDTTNEEASRTESGPP